MKNKLILLFILLLQYSSVAYAKEHIVIDDMAGILNQQEYDAISVYNRKLFQEYLIDYHLVTTNSDLDINQFANQYFNKHNIGAGDGNGKGLLIIINPKQGLVRMEVSSVLEPIYTDAFVSYIEHRQMIPFFKSGQVTNGILATTEFIFDRAIKAKKGEEFDENVLLGSKGGGVSNKSEIGKGMDVKSNEQITTKSSMSPQQVVDAYLWAMEQRNNNPDLSIYSKETKVMQHNWVVTPAQMDMVVRTFKSCKAETLHELKDLAVVRYNINDRACSPFFLIKENGEWKLDLTMMMKAIRFNHRNEWHFDMRTKNDYAFAFKDWKFNKYGFPIE